jgi:hypothetical protein
MAVRGSEFEFQRCIGICLAQRTEARERLPVGKKEK